MSAVALGLVVVFGVGKKPRWAEKAASSSAQEGSFASVGLLSCWWLLVMDRPAGWWEGWVMISTVSGLRWPSVMAEEEASRTGGM